VTANITYGLERWRMYLAGASIRLTLVSRRPAAKLPRRMCSTRTRSSIGPTTSNNANVDKRWKLFDFYESEANRLMSC